MIYLTDPINTPSWAVLLLFQFVSTSVPHIPGRTEHCPSLSVIVVAQTAFGDCTWVEVTKMIRS